MNDSAIRAAVRRLFAACRSLEPEVVVQRRDVELLLASFSGVSGHRLPAEPPHLHPEQR